MSLCRFRAEGHDFYGDRSAGRHRHVFTAIDLDLRLQAPFRAHCTDASDLGQHLGQKGLPPESRINHHDQDNVTKMQDIFDKLRRARRVKHDANLLAEFANLGQHPMEMDRRTGFSLDEQMIGPRLGEGGKIALWLDDHQMHVERLRRRATDGLENDRANRQVRHEAAVHHIDVNPVGAGSLNRANFFAQSGEIG